MNIDTWFASFSVAQRERIEVCAQRIAFMHLKGDVGAIRGFVGKVRLLYPTLCANPSVDACLWVLEDLCDE